MDVISQRLEKLIRFIKRVDAGNPARRYVREFNTSVLTFGCGTEFVVTHSTFREVGESYRLDEESWFSTYEPKEDIYYYEKTNTSDKLDFATYSAWVSSRPDPVSIIPEDMVETTYVIAVIKCLPNIPYAVIAHTLQDMLDAKPSAYSDWKGSALYKAISEAD